MSIQLKTISFQKVAFATLVATTALAASSSLWAADMPKMEKCYGVAAASHNDCATASNSCAGTVKVAREATAFIAVPKGVCEKISGGSTSTPMAAKK